jgi:hypothetical protein
MALNRDNEYLGRPEMTDPLQPKDRRGVGSMMTRLSLMAVVALCVNTTAFAAVPSTSFVLEASAPVDLGLADPGLAGFTTSYMVTTSSTDWTNALIDLQLISGTVNHIGTDEPLPQDPGDTSVFDPGNPALGTIVDEVPDDFVETPTRFAASWYNTATDDTGSFSIAALTLSNDAFGLLEGENLSGGDVDEFRFRVTNGMILPYVTADYDFDGNVGVDDLELLQLAIRGGAMDDIYDLDGNPGVDNGDFNYMVDDELGLLAGDNDGDLVVDAFDIREILVAGKFGQGFTNAVWSEGDYDNDGDVDASDIQQILAHGQFGQGSYAALSLLTVPEPTSLALLGLGGLALLRRRRA